MTAGDLDEVYTGICQTMTRMGESNANLFLARFALLAIARLGDAAAAKELIAAAAANIEPAAHPLAGWRPSLDG